jgi:hypothetical protein
MTVASIADIVPYLVCEGNIVVPYLDFRKSSEPARSLYLIQLTHDQVQRFSKAPSSQKTSTTLVRLFTSLARPLREVGGIEIPSDGLRVA